MAQSTRTQQMRDERKAVTGGKTIKYTPEFLLKFAQVRLSACAGSRGRGRVSARRWVRLARPATRLPLVTRRLSSD